MIIETRWRPDHFSSLKSGISFAHENLEEFLRGKDKFSFTLTGKVLQNVTMIPQLGEKLVSNKRKKLKGEGRSYSKLVLLLGEILGFHDRQCESGCFL
jgi:hypothetical protein